MSKANYGARHGMSRLTKWLTWSRIWSVTWKQHKRTDPVVNAGSAFVSLRPSGLAFSRGFVLKANVASEKRVTLLIDEARHRIGFRFHSQQHDADAYALTSDGGHAARRGGGARWMQGKLIYAQYPWLADALKRPAMERRYKVQRDERHDVWFIEIAPRGREP